MEGEAGQLPGMNIRLDASVGEQLVYEYVSGAPERRGAYSRPVQQGGQRGGGQLRQPTTVVQRPDGQYWRRPQGQGAGQPQ